MKEWDDMMGEIGLLSRTGRSRVTKKKEEVTEKMVQEKSGPVVIKQYPNFVKQIDRMEYARGDRTQEQFAEELGIYPAYYSKIKTGKMRPTEKMLQRICEITGCPKDWIQGGEKEVKKSEEPVTKNSPNAGKHQVNIVGEYLAEEIQQMCRDLIEGELYEISATISISRGARI